jgi:hypothetical protein
MRTIFVFGSNREGRHGKGAALFAKLYHGALQGYPEGLQGDSYAIITKELRPWVAKVTLADVKAGVDRFIEFANTHKYLEFIVTPIGTSLAGFTISQIAPLFASVEDALNVRLCTEIRRELAIQRGDEYVPVPAQPFDSEPSK